MKANQGKVTALLIVAALSLTACDIGAGRGRGETITYTNVSNGEMYTLIITENTARYAAQKGDRYALIRNPRKSIGTVDEVSGTVLTLLPYRAEETFRATVSGTRLIALDGRITWADGTIESAPGSLTTPSYPSSPYPPEAPGVWTIVYNANGGEGTMASDTALANQDLTLRANAFTRTDCTFVSWAESAAGEMPHAAGADVTGHAAGTTLTLYALWDVESGKEAAVVKTAVTKGNGTAIALTGVAWSDDLKTAVENALSGGNKDLDLSGVSGLTAWNKDSLDSAVKKYITSLVLPDTLALLYSDKLGRAFENYSSLTSVSGAGVREITLSSLAFCTALTTVSLPAAEEIGNNAFQKCTALTSLTLPAKPPELGSNVFYETGASSEPLEIHVGSGNTGDYEKAWGVTGKNPIGPETIDTTGKYGNNHKAITIMN
jgi:hypothetical protein